MGLFCFILFFFYGKKGQTVVNCSTLSPVIQSLVLTQIVIYCKNCLKRPLKKKFKTDYRLMQVQSIAECSKGSILQYFRPSLSYQSVFKSFVLSIFEGPLKTGFTVSLSCNGSQNKLYCKGVIYPYLTNIF